VTNTGTRDTRQGFWYDRVLPVEDPSLDNTDQMLGQFERAGLLATGRRTRAT